MNPQRPRLRRRPLAPSTEKLYRATLQRAGFPGKLKDLSGWTAGPMKALRAAVARSCPERLDELPDEVYEIERVITPPTEAELRAYEKEVAGRSSYGPAGRALMLLPLMLGLRASETLMVKRRDVERAVGGEELLVLRKGGREQLLPAFGVQKLLHDMLKSPIEWALSWELLSRVSKDAAYTTLYRLIRDAGTRAGVEKLRPHKLRHGFASRMERAGASLPQIQKMMDHASPTMTMRYVHPENKDIVKFMQGGK